MHTLNVLAVHNGEVSELTSHSVNTRRTSCAKVREERRHVEHGTQTSKHLRHGSVNRCIVSSTHQVNHTSFIDVSNGEIKTNFASTDIQFRTSIARISSASVAPKHVTRGNNNVFRCDLLFIDIQNLLIPKIRIKEESRSKVDSTTCGDSSVLIDIKNVNILERILCITNSSNPRKICIVNLHQYFFTVHGEYSVIFRNQSKFPDIFIPICFQNITTHDIHIFRIHDGI